MPTMTTPTNFEVRSLRLLAELNTAIGGSAPGGGSGFVDVDRVQEWSAIEVSTTGQPYPFSSIPSSGDCLVCAYCKPGWVSGVGSISIIFENPAKVSKRTPTAGFLPNSGTVIDLGVYLDNASYYSANHGTILLKAKGGQIWANRAGNYSAGHLV